MSTFRRIVRISLVSVADIALLGGVAGFVFFPSFTGAMFGFWVAGVLGMAIIPVSVGLLWKKRLERAVAWRLVIGLVMAVTLGLVCNNPLHLFLGCLFGWMTATGLVFFLVADEGPRPGFCACCGYNLTGNVSGVCPECGTRIGAQENAG